MSFVDLQIAVRSLAQHRKRTLFLGAATAAVTLVLVMMNGLTAGIQEMLLKTGSTLMTGHVNVGGFFKPSAGLAAPLVNDYATVLGHVKQQVPELDFAVTRGRGYAKAVSETAAMDLVLGGIDILEEEGFREVVRAVDGSLDELAKPNTLLIFETQAKRLGVKAGDAVTLVAPTSRGMSNTADVRIAAVARDLGVLSSFNAFMPSESLRQLYQLKAGSTGAIHLYLKDHGQSPQVAARLRTVLAEAGYRLMDPDPQPYYMKLMMKVTREDWTGQKLDVTTWEDELSQMSQMTKILDALTGLLTFILLVIVAVGVMNTMWIAIRERTREIGTMRAIGMGRGKVLVMFLLEAAMLGLGGSTVGAALAGLSALGLNAMHIALPESVQMILMADHLRLSLSAGAVLFAIGFLTFITTLTALFPAILATRLKPITAMHHLG